MHALTITFVNPIDENLGIGGLYNLVSRSPVNVDIAQKPLSVSQIRVDLMQAFNSRFHSLNASNAPKF